MLLTIGVTLSAVAFVESSAPMEQNRHPVSKKDKEEREKLCVLKEAKSGAMALWRSVKNVMTSVVWRFSAVGTAETAKPNARVAKMALVKYMVTV